MNSPFGVLEFLHWNHSWNNYKYPDLQSLERSVSLMKKAGICWVRMDFLWQEIEPQQGKFEFAKYDRIVSLLEKHGIAILGILHYNTPWNSDVWNETPKDNSLFVNYASKVIRHYKSKVQYWEVWNEPDSSIYWNKQDGLKGYCQLLKEVYQAAKKENPGCKVLNGGFANGLLSVNRLYDNGAKDYFDILNIHIFESPLNEKSIKAVTAYARLAYKVMSRNGDAHKKIWVTEIGCPGVRKGLDVDNWWMGKNPDEAEQAGWVQEVYGGLLANEAVERVFWAFFRDCNKHWGNGIDHFGLIRQDYSLKPSFHAYRKFVHTWKKKQK
ncbi:MAG: family 1 glycosylhydrolase [Candidatus Omnitrophica bacterium]|nr:family 1 glycosylhydrolase [Candidatus Omnitrophota bacterium]